MKLDDSLFDEFFTAEKVPHWSCPSCFRGVLRLDKKDFLNELDGPTESSKDHPAFDHDWARYVFHGLLRCPTCGEKVVFCGTGKVEQDYDEMAENGWSYFYLFSPKYFHPAVRLVQVDFAEAVPNDVLQSVDKASELFWADLDASANRIRTAVEYILDDLKIPRGKRVTLHSRIEQLDSGKFPVVKPLLEAVKWLGNTGSHELGRLARSDLIDGFRMLEHCISVLYPKPPVDASAILAKANAIISAKGPVRAPSE